MYLNELKKGTKATILRIGADESLKNRLMSFGVIRGAQVEINEYSSAKQTIKISVNNTMLALRLEEARQIEVSDEQ